MILPRAIEACYSLLKEKGILRPITGGESLMCISAMVSIVYYYIHEEHLIDSSYKKTIDKYMNLTRDEGYLR